MPVILSTHELHPRATTLLSPYGTLRVAAALDEETLRRETEDADVVIVRAPLPSALFAGAPRLRAAIRHGAGLDMIPIEAATAAGVLVANVPGANAITVAEHVIYTSMALLRRLRMVDRDLRGTGWLAGRDHANAGHDLTGRSIGIVGMGAVGREVARIAHHGFGLAVSGTNRSGTGLPDYVEQRALDVLVEASDILVLCCPLTPETTGLIDARRLARMRHGAILVNVARGAVVDEAALVETLRTGRLAGAALDVFSKQPLAADHPLFGFDNVILTPHMAGITEESMMRMGLGAAEETIRVLGGELPLNLRNPEVVARYRDRFSG